MKVSVSFQKEFWTCPECGIKLPIESPHKCANIRIRKFISKRIFLATLRNTVISSLLTFIIFLSFLLWQSWTIISLQNKTIQMSREYIAGYDKTQEVILNTQREIADSFVYRKK
jgi:hypothetical protein